MKEKIVRYRTGESHEIVEVVGELVRCKDCRKQNKRVGFDENFNPVYKEDACPLVSWRGIAKGHEFDYQFCCCAERKTE